MGENGQNHINLKIINIVCLLLLLFLFLSLYVSRPSDAVEHDKITKFPSHPIRIMAPAAPGGSIGQEVRTIAPFLEKSLKVSTIIDYVTGADGMIAYNKFYREKPDGYTLLYFNLTAAISLELTREGAKYVVKNLIPIAGWNIKNQVFAVHPDNWKSFSDLLNDAKKRRISVAGTGGVTVLQIYLLEGVLGIKFNFVPYTSAGEVVGAVAGKHIELGLGNSIILKPMIQSGKLRALAVWSSKRDPILPAVPLLSELGHNEIPLLIGYGIIAAPPNTPKEIAAILEKAVIDATAAPDFKRIAENVGIDVDFRSSSELNKLMQESYELVNKYKEFVK